MPVICIERVNWQLCLSLGHLRESIVGPPLWHWSANKVMNSVGAGLCNIMKGTHSDPSQSGSRIINIFDYAKDMLVEFCREPKVPAASM
jgi:hypothetical protein